MCSDFPVDRVMYWMIRKSMTKSVRRFFTNDCCNTNTSFSRQQATSIFRPHCDLRVMRHYNYNIQYYSKLSVCFAQPSKNMFRFAVVFAYPAPLKIIVEPTFLWTLGSITQKLSLSTKLIGLKYGVGWGGPWIFIVTTYVSHVSLVGEWHYFINSQSISWDI